MLIFNVQRPEIKGSSTEIALLKFTDKCGIDYEKIREQSQVVHRFPFNSSRKRMSVIIKTADGRLRLMVKGAAELVLDSCSQIHSFSNEISQMDSTNKDKCVTAMETMAKEALRTLVLAYKDLSGSESIHFSL